MVGAGKTVSDMTSVTDENFPDPTDRALLESNRNFTLRLRDRERKLLAKIKEAMKRIDDGTFGICEGCGGDRITSYNVCYTKLLRSPPGRRDRGS